MELLIVFLVYITVGLAITQYLTYKYFEEEFQSNRQQKDEETSKRMEEYKNAIKTRLMIMMIFIWPYFLVTITADFFNTNTKK